MTALKTKVLIVEDESEIREELVKCLTEEGFDCVEASNGEEGLDVLCRDLDITIVLIDIIMPQKSGLEMIRNVKSVVGQNRHLEFIILTGHGGLKDTIYALKLGAIAFLEKPPGQEHLVHVVRRVEELVFLKRASRQYEASLKADVQTKTLEIQKLLDNFESAYGESLECLAGAAGRCNGVRCAEYNESPTLFVRWTGLRSGGEEYDGERRRKQVCSLFYSLAITANPILADQFAV
jgi:putative two-component system response regulator